MKRMLIISVLLCTTLLLQAQDIKGSWQGYLTAGTAKLRVVFNVSKPNDWYAVTMDSPDQNAFGIKCDEVRITADSVVFGVLLLKGGYSGKRENDSTITGILSQGPGRYPVTLTRLRTGNAPKATAAEKEKPQTPQPPFDYLSEEVSYSNNAQGVKLAGSLTRPKAGSKFPVVILITGSGPQDRDETIGRHKSFFVIADYLAKKGIAVLRVDDRGVGKSTGNFSQATSADFATDVMAGIDYLKTRIDIDTARIGLMGHSEGGLIAPYVAARRKDVAFIVMLAGPAVGGKPTMIYQGVDKLLVNANRHDRDAYAELYDKMFFGTALNDDAQKDVPAYIKTVYFNWKKKQPDSTLKNLVPQNDDYYLSAFTRGANDFTRPWWRFFLSHDVSQDLKKLRIPVLALNGEKDEQVDPKTNLSLIRQLLTRNGNTHFKVYEVPGVNHLFQHCKACGSVKEYLELEETFDPATLEIIGSWIVQETKPGVAR